jgi:fermentation-respiration switch protein FrsA (DUF1100 family)
MLRSLIDLTYGPGLSVQNERTVMSLYERKDLYFQSGGERCAAWLYMPGGVRKPPVVVMAHGFAAERSFRLPAFAECFAEKGMASLVFDYRNFGDSTGEPRNLVDPTRHLQDWAAAITHVRTLAEVDGNRVALWGSSFSGGHVIVAAARDQRIAAVVSQVPFVDGLASVRVVGPKFALRATMEGMMDLIPMITGSTPYYVPVIGKPDTFAVMNTPDAYDGYMAIVPSGSSWKNQCPARILLKVSMYRPTRYAKKVSCPLLVVRAEKDMLMPSEAVGKMVEQTKLGELFSLPLGHFDVYAGKSFETVAEAEAHFLAKHLGIPV